MVVDAVGRGQESSPGGKGSISAVGVEGGPEAERELAQIVSVSARYLAAVFPLPARAVRHLRLSQVPCAAPG